MMTAQRPARVVPITHSWESQAWQYLSRTDIPRQEGIVAWTVPAHLVAVPVECLLFWVRGSRRLRLAGIFNYYPQGSPHGEQPHDTLTLVNPRYRRQGIGTALLREALRRWPHIDLLAQSYTDEGWALVSSMLEQND